MSHRLLCHCLRCYATFSPWSNKSIVNVFFSAKLLEIRDDSRLMTFNFDEGKDFCRIGSVKGSTSKFQKLSALWGHIFSQDSKHEVKIPVVSNRNP